MIINLFILPMDFIVRNRFIKVSFTAINQPPPLPGYAVSVAKIREKGDFFQIFFQKFVNILFQTLLWQMFFIQKGYYHRLPAKDTAGDDGGAAMPLFRGRS
ncbi:MAG: hypothetical protein IJV33_08855 [Bacteroidaceae bacterium]|nr:hypothetical protein [Bacteroidaceae bacterium]